MFWGIDESPWLYTNCVCCVSTGCENNVDQGQRERRGRGAGRRRGSGEWLSVQENLCPLIALCVAHLPVWSGWSCGSQASLVPWGRASASGEPLSSITVGTSCPCRGKNQSTHQPAPTALKAGRARFSLFAPVPQEVPSPPPITWDPAGTWSS